MGKASRRKRERREGAYVPNTEGTVFDRGTGALGSVAVLNVGAGDLKLSFDKAVPAERKKAKSVVQDMLRRGYAILVQVDVKDGEPVYQRVKAFDPETCEYLVVGLPEKPAAARPAKAPKADRTVRIPAERTRTVAVARSAGG